MGHPPHDLAPGSSDINVMTTKSLLLTEFGGSVSADVDAPADDVFALLTDTSRLPEWNARIRRVLEPAPAPLAPGAEWVVQMQVAGPGGRAAPPR